MASELFSIFFWFAKFPAGDLYVIELLCLSEKIIFLSHEILKMVECGVTAHTQIIDSYSVRNVMTFTYFRQRDRVLLPFRFGSQRCGG
jgi:hypothetical protein